MTSSPTRILLSDDHHLLLQALSARLSADPRLQVVGTAADCEETIRITKETQPDLLLLDLNLPGRGAFEVIEELQRSLPNLKILILSGFFSEVFLSHLLRLNVAGYLLKSDSIESLLESIATAASGGKCYSAEVRKHLHHNQANNRLELSAECQLGSLTGRQLEVLRHLARGQSVKEIAREMHLSQKSIDSHKYRIMHKLGIHDRVELARYAIREGLTPP